MQVINSSEAILNYSLLSIINNNNSKWLENLRNSLLDRVNRSYNILEGSKAFKLSKPKGGYFLWIRLNDNVNLERMHRAFPEYNIIIITGDVFVQESDREKPEFLCLKRRIRVSYSYNDLDKLIEGLSIMRKCIESAVEI